MSASFPVEIQHSIELELTVTGTFEPGYAETRTDPGAEDEIWPGTITAIEAVRSNPDRKFGDETKPRWITVNILDGVDTKSPDVQRLIENLMGIVWNEAETALMEEARG